LNIEYQTHHSIPNDRILEGIIKLHEDIFGTSNDLLIKMNLKPKLLVMTAMDGENLVGYKIGYELDENRFYSWLGGVKSDYRKKGIASTLMKMQHHYLKTHGYHVVQTKTMNKWRNMLVLNIQSGFNVIGTYTDEKGLHKIILEKNLLANAVYSSTE
jgi:predicted GNAT superfamily acetyltransferase